MAFRVATSMKTSTHQNYLRQLESKKFKLQNTIAGENKLQSLADNPAASALSTKYMSDMNRFGNFSKNIERIKLDNENVHSQLLELSSQMARVREITIQSAQNSYSPEDLKNTAMELDQILTGMLDIANQADESGNARFAGTQKMNKAFEGYMGRVPGGDSPMVVQVNYLGNHLKNEISIDNSKNIEIDRAGSRLFWGGPEEIYSRVDASQYRVLQDTSVVVNGQEISLHAGDNIHSIVARINSATVAVTADVDHTNNSLILKGNRAEQLVLQNGPNSTVLSDLGLITEGITPPYNISPYTSKKGGNIFNQLIDVRDMMLKGDSASLGTRGLNAINEVHTSIINSLATVGAQVGRLDAMSSSIATRHLNTAESNRNEAVVTDMDRTEMLLEYKELDNVHTATLQSAAKALKPSLLDFLR